MGTFKVDIEIGDPQGQRFEHVEALVDTGSSYTVLPRPLLERLGVRSHGSRTFRLAHGRLEKQDIGRTWVRVDGQTEMTIVVFGPEGAAPLLGAYALEGLLLAADPVGKRLVPVEGLLMVERQTG